MIKKILRITTILLFVSAVAAYMVYAFTIRQQSKEDAECSGLVFDIRDNPHARFIDESGIRDMIVAADINPVGKKLSNVNLTQIEQVVGESQYVDSVECFRTAGNKVCVTVIMRTPVMYVLSDSSDYGYFVDSHGNIIKDTKYATDIAIATGSISRRYATTALVEFGNFLNENDFWNNQIEQIHVTGNGGAQETIELVPRIGDQIIHLGSITDFEVKLRRMRLFYEKAMPEVGWNHYSRFNLEYENQVVCTKRKHEHKADKETDTEHTDTNN